MAKTEKELKIERNTPFQWATLEDKKRSIKRHEQPHEESKGE